MTNATTVSRVRAKWLDLCWLGRDLRNDGFVREQALRYFGTYPSFGLHSGGAL